MTGRRAGLVLAGGFSTRFGDRDKAVAAYDGEPMVRRVVRRVGEVTDGVVVNCRAEQVPALRTELSGYPRVALAVDPVPDRGPMAGIWAGLRAIRAPYTAVVACDMPQVDPEFLELLFERAAGADGALVRTDDGWFQTTQAVYRTDAMRAACEQVLGGEDARILAALDRLTIRELSENAVPDMTTFTDVNEVGDLP
ncbi:molybdenum cofactor guanylyltransferase [Haloarchaeobius amylolyticus]|uniref:molybdenum cofactor guanylyltransferase n=1 Tax=Haloarchaeobius amylolyticus TaxID=1198296 RepID=UPI0022720E73|nr:molybdenum cofactor guanylyltransferase [Haloarchaeobius amylolyticus]